MTVTLAGGVGVSGCLRGLLRRGFVVLSFSSTIQDAGIFHELRMLVHLSLSYILMRMAEPAAAAAYASISQPGDGHKDRRDLERGMLRRLQGRLYVLTEANITAAVRYVSITN